MRPRKSMQEMCTRFCAYRVLVFVMQYLVTCLERAHRLALWYVMFSCVSVTFPNDGVLGQVRYLIVSILDICLLSYFDVVSSNHLAGATGGGRMQAGYFTFITF